MPKPKFPKCLFVTSEQDGDETYLVAHEGGLNHSTIEDATACAVYELVDVGHVAVARGFLSQKK